MKKLNIDYLNLYRGSAIGICSGIALHIPTLSEICEYGETRYYQMVTTLCSTGIDFCWQLDEMGIPFDFASYCANTIPPTTPGSYSAAVWICQK